MRSSSRVVCIREDFTIWMSSMSSIVTIRYWDNRLRIGRRSGVSGLSMTTPPTMLPSGSVVCWATSLFQQQKLVYACNHAVLFQLLLDRNLPVAVIRFLLLWSNQLQSELLFTLTSYSFQWCTARWSPLSYTFVIHHMLTASASYSSW